MTLLTRPAPPILANLGLITQGDVSAWAVTDEANAKLACQACHDWVHAHPKAAAKLGLLLSRKGNGSWK